ncbi:MAG: preprotein translocase subunit YajC [Eubacteriales bacterium]|nr:preprotein translocase subunit YajC [Eubacteriales bacterium]
MTLLQFMVLAQAAATEAMPGGSMLGMFLPLIIVFGLMYFITIRPQKKKEEELRKQINAMQVGDEVVTIGGVTGRIFNIQDDEITISTSVQNTLMTFKKSAVAHVMSPTAKAEAQQRKAEAEARAKTEEGTKKPSFLDKLKGKKDEE